MTDDQCVTNNVRLPSTHQKCKIIMWRPQKGASKSWFGVTSQVTHKTDAGLDMVGNHTPSTTLQGEWTYIDDDIFKIPQHLVPGLFNTSCELSQQPLKQRCHQRCRLEGTPWFSHSRFGLQTSQPANLPWSFPKGPTPIFLANPRPRDCSSQLVETFM